MKRLLLTVHKYCNKPKGNSHILNKSVVHYWTNLFLKSPLIIILRETTYLVNKGTEATYLIYKGTVSNEKDQLLKGG